jgi:hypothetical protein
MLKTEQEAYDTFSYDAMTHLKQIISHFDESRETFTFIVRDAIRKWKRCDQKSLANYLVSSIFGELGEQIYD